MSHIIQEDAIADKIHAQRKVWGWWFLLSVAFLFCFVKAICSLVRLWHNSYIYSYGFLVPLISFYIVWGQRRKLKHIQPWPSYFPGFLVLLAAMTFLVIGITHEKTSIQGLSLIAAIAGVILLLLGRQFLIALWFPVAYLLFMVPFWDNLIEGLHLPFQNFSAWTGVILLRLTGIPVYRESVYISLPNITLEVAKVCSGVNQLIAIVAVAIPLAYLILENWFKRIVLIGGSIAIAIVGNGLRVAIIGVLSYYGISNVLHGPYHVLQAMSISILGFIALFIGAWILSRSSVRAGASAQVDKTVDSGIYLLSNSYTELRYPFLLAIGILLLVGSYINFYR